MGILRLERCRLWWKERRYILSDLLIKLVFGNTEITFRLHFALLIRDGQLDGLLLELDRIVFSSHGYLAARMLILF